MNRQTLSLVGLLLICVAGCTTLRDVKKELRAGGFELWYPAEGGVEPGQIWFSDGRIKNIQQERPGELPVRSTQDAEFGTLLKHIEAKASLDAKFSDKILGKAGDLSALLGAATVRDVRLDFGKATVTRVALGNLKQQAVLDKLPSGYRDDLYSVRDGTRPLIFIAGVVQVSGMKYTFTCEDTGKLKAAAPKIAESINATFDVSASSKTEAVWEIPDSKTLTIGIAPVQGDFLALSDRALDDAVRSAVGFLQDVRRLNLGAFLMDTMPKDR